MAAGEAATLLHLAPYAITSPDLSKWERKFLASMIARNRRSKFTPSNRQGHALRQIINRWKESSMSADLTDVTEKGIDQ